MAACESVEFSAEEIFNLKLPVALFNSEKDESDGFKDEILTCKRSIRRSPPPPPCRRGGR